jgi:glycolate oxidase iron-sulfur subunit
MRLAVDEDELAACVSCGLCLPHCPTYRVTGLESASPRGRIATMRALDAGELEVGPEAIEVLDLCVQCRGCEAACPSSVPFGRLMEGTRATLVARAGYQPWWRRLGYASLGRHSLVLAASSALAVAQRVGLPLRRLGLPSRMALRRPALRPSGDDAWLFTGCVMDAWLRPVHAAAKRVMEATGAGVALPGPAGACCGALHQHAGLEDQARRLARRVMAAMPGEAPVVVDSAGCGAAMKAYGELLGTPEAEAFTRRVKDLHEWLAEPVTPATDGGMTRLDRLPPAARLVEGPVAVADPCHLRHVQRAHQHVRTVLRPYVEELVELDDEGLCCGAGGAYAAFHPKMAQAIRERKLDAIARSGAVVAASANPGCMLHLTGAGPAEGGVDVRHPIELVADAIWPPDVDGGRDAAATVDPEPARAGERAAG